MTPLKKYFLGNAVISFAFSAYYLWLFIAVFEIQRFSARNLLAISAFLALAILSILLSRAPSLEKYGNNIVEAIKRLNKFQIIGIFAILWSAASIIVFQVYLELATKAFSLPIHYLPIAIYVSVNLVLMAQFLVNNSAGDNHVVFILISLNIIFIIFLTLNPNITNSYVVADDSGLYFGRNNLSYIFDADLWNRFQPFSLPLIYTLIGNTVPNLLKLHSILHIFGWSFLAWSVSTKPKNKAVKIFGFLAILLYSLTPQIHSWNVIALTESLSFSLMAILLSLLLLYRDIPKTAYFFSLSLIGTIWTFLHYSHVFTLIPLTILLLMVAYYSKHRKRIIFSSLIFMLILVGSYFQIKKANRQIYHSTLTMFFRVLPFPDRLDFFYANGMPKLDDYDNKNALIQLPEDSEFKIWARDHLQSTYLLLLINRFPDSLFEPFRETFFPTWYSGQNHWIDIDYQPLLSERILEYLQFDQWDLPLILMTSLIAVFTLISVIRNKSEIGFTALILLLISVTQFILNWHSDAGELERHSLLASIEFKLAFLFGLLCTLDLLIAWSKKPFSLLIQSKP